MKQGTRRTLICQWILGCSRVGYTYPIPMQTGYWTTAMSCVPALAVAKLADWQLLTRCLNEALEIKPSSKEPELDR